MHTHCTRVPRVPDLSVPRALLVYTQCARHRALHTRCVQLVGRAAMTLHADAHTHTAKNIGTTGRTVPYIAPRVCF
jgi:hypothetical protein